MNIVQRYSSIILLAATIVSCKKNDDIIEPAPQAVNLEVPVNFPSITNDPNNPLTKEGIELGRLLFYDNRLSGNNLISCASCHKQDLAFSDGVALNNIGFSGNTLHRNAPALINMAWANNGLFWDGGSTNLESQAFAPLASEDEMHQNLYQLVDELNAIPDYVNRFRFVFRDNEIKTGYIVKALAQFQRTFISANSKYDKFKRHEAGGTLTTSEELGLQVVRTRCTGCHATDLFTDNDYHNNGLDSDFSNTAFEEIFLGRSRITYNPADIGKFKTPTLRNIMLSAPYMHDGRFANIQQVLDHYSNGVKASPTLDPLMQVNGRPTVPLSATDKQNIIAFLKTLTDSAFINNKALSKP